MAGREGVGEAYGSAKAFGTFGELLQGALPDGTDFLVTMPIARWSTARFLFDPRAGAVHARPGNRSKSRRLAETMLARHGVSGGGVLWLDSELPVGKGLASSSADLVATARAVGRAIGVDPDAAEIEELARPIEPTDGVMYQGVVAFHHCEVRLRSLLGHLPPMTVVGIDEGGEIETVGFNRRPKDFSGRETRAYEGLLAVLTAAIAAGDAEAIGRVATQSARMNQRLCPKQTLEDMIGLCREVDGLGVVAAHSGTALGILLADSAPGHQDRLRRTGLGCSRLSQTVWVDRCLPVAHGDPLAAPGLGYLPADRWVTESRPMSRRSTVPETGRSRRTGGTE